jgi:hypothetical protein
MRCEPFYYICNPLQDFQMKSELVSKLTELLKSDDIYSVREAVRDIRNDWKAETAKERQEQLEIFRKTQEENPHEDEFVYAPHEMEGRFQELMGLYEDRVEEHGKKLAAERQKNLEDKLAILDEFQKTIQEEENIAKAFGAHKVFKERWEAIGDVPGDKYHDLNDRWQKLNHTFFYNINIYKSLQAHDLKINQKKKEELTEEARRLSEIESISELEIMVRKYDREWKSIGPSPRETYEAMGDTFFGILREAQARIQAHYDEIHKHSDENLAKKMSLVQRMGEVLSMELVNLAAWNKWTDEVLQMQEEWRTIGWARKKDNEDAWQQFRGLCDLFFSKRKSFFEEKRSAFKHIREKKEELLERARAIQNSEDWKSATEEFKKLQEEWKAAGAADPRDEQKLWQKFRSVCDHFFQRKKENFAKLTEEQQQNLLLKEDLLRELAALELSGNRGTDLGVLKQFSEKWHAVGFVPRDRMKEIAESYNKLMDQKYGTLNAEREHREMDRFRNRLDNLRGSADGEFKVKRERTALKEKIDRLKHQIKQYENNMGIFTGKGAEALRKDIEKKIKSSEREIEDLKKKLELLN